MSKVCIFCEKEKQAKDFRTPQEHEPAIKGDICKSCYTWLQLKVKKHGQRAGDTLTILTWLNILERSSGYCAYCKKHIGLKFLTIEHIIPIIQGGTNKEENIAAVCKSCNSTKGGR